MSLIENLKQRKLVEWALAYLAGAWVVVQAMEALSEPLGLSLGVQRGLLLVLVAGLPVVMTLSWYHGEQGRQRVSGMELLILTGLLAGAGLLLGVVGPGDPMDEDGAEAALLPPATGNGLPVLAVLPFVNRSGLSDDQHFTDGIHDQVLTELSKRGDVRLLSRTSVQEYRETQKSIREIAAELGATHLVEGAVQRAGEEVLVTAQLINDTDQHLWSNDYQRELTVANLFDIQREVAQRVARELGLRLAPAEDRGDGIPTDSLDAWLAYQQARLLNPSDTLRLALAQHAVALDSSFVEAWAELAAAHGVQAVERRRFESRPLALEALQRARELDPDNVTVLEAEVAVQYWVEFDFRRALEVADEVLQRLPNSRWVLLIKARIHERLGEWDQAFAAYDRGIALDPRSFQVLALPWHLAFGTRRFDLARRYLERARLVARTEEEREHLWRDSGLLAFVEQGDTSAYLRQLRDHGLEVEPQVCNREIAATSFSYLRRQFDRALELCRRARGRGADRFFRAARLAEWVDESATKEIYADSLRAFVMDYHARLDSVDYGRYGWPRAWTYATEARSHALFGDRAEVLKAGRRALEVFTPKDDERDTGRIAQLLIEPYIMIGDHEAAMDMMVIASRTAWFYPAVWRLDPAYDPLRDHPRFQGILRDMEEPR